MGTYDPRSHGIVRFFAVINPNQINTGAYIIIKLFKRLLYCKQRTYIHNIYRILRKTCSVMPCEWGLKHGRSVPVEKALPISVKDITHRK